MRAWSFFFFFSFSLPQSHFEQCFQQRQAGISKVRLCFGCAWPPLSCAHPSEAVWLWLGNTQGNTSHPVLPVRQNPHSCWCQRQNFIHHTASLYQSPANTLGGPTLDLERREGRSILTSIAVIESCDPPSAKFWNASRGTTKRILFYEKEARMQRKYKAVAAEEQSCSPCAGVLSLVSASTPHFCAGYPSALALASEPGKASQLQGQNLAEVQGQGLPNVTAFISSPNLFQLYLPPEEWQEDGELMKHIFPWGNFLLVLFCPPWQWVITVCPKESESLEVISMPCKLVPGNINADAAVIQLEFEINIAESFLTECFAFRKFKSI